MKSDNIALNAQRSETEPQAVPLNYAHCPKPTPRGNIERPGLASLVCGFIFVLPLVMQFYAIALGILAVRGKPKSADRGMGIAGLLMGIAGLLFWACVFLVLVFAHL
jgi:hypothetical protein